MSEATPPTRDQYRTIGAASLVVFPLTYDESDSTGTVPLTRLGAGPHITPEGFNANGYDSRYQAAVTSIGAGASASLHAVARLDGEARTTHDTLVSLTHATTDQPKIELAACPDPTDSTQVCVALRQYAGSVASTRLNRPGWRFEFRFPELVNGRIPSPQSLAFQDADTLIIAAHESDITTVLYRVDLTTGDYTGRASSAEYIHLNSMHFRENGELWANAYVASLGSNRMIRIDLDTSFSTGAVTVDQLWDTGSLPLSISFATIAGTDYVLCQEYATSGTPYLYVFLASQIGTTVGAADRVARYSLGLRIQDVFTRSSDGLLYASRNVKQGGSVASGFIQAYDIAAALSMADGSTLAPVATYPAPSGYAEGLGFRPGDDRLWSLTEGLVSVSDLRSHAAVWSTDLDSGALVPQENAYLVDYDGASRLLEVRLNGRLMVSGIVTAPTVNPTKLSIGAPPSASAGWATGFMTDGIVRMVALKDGLFTLDELAALASGEYEPNTLSVFPITLTNPGAEVGVTGWTDELSGNLATRSANPAPYAGAAYFVGANSANNRARQRVTLASLGCDPATLGALWARVEWQQASFDASSDPGGCGIRALDSSNAQLALLPSGEVSVVPSLAWRSRAHAASLPAGSAAIDVLQHRTRTAGVNVDTYVDAVDAVVYAQQL